MAENNTDISSADLRDVVRLRALADSVHARTQARLEHAGQALEALETVASVKIALANALDLWGDSVPEDLRREAVKALRQDDVESQAMVMDKLARVIDHE